MMPKEKLLPSFILTGLMLLSLVVVPAGGVVAQEIAEAPSPTVTEDSHGIHLSWEAGATSLEAAATSWSTVEFAGQRLPARLITVTFEPGVEPAITLQKVKSEAASDATNHFSVVDPAEAKGDGESTTRAAGPVLPQKAIALPTGPVVEIRRGIRRGEAFAVFALFAYFQQGEEVVALRALEATISGARLAKPESTSIADRREPIILNGLRAPESANALLLQVYHPGMQEIEVGHLLENGLISSSSELSRLRLTLNGRVVPLEQIGQHAVRFYADQAGDRRNPYTAYRLVLSGGDQPALNVRPALSADGGTSLLTWGMEPGRYYRPRMYDSALPGEDGDHFFSLDLRSGPGLDVARIQIPLETKMAGLAGPVMVTLSGAAYTYVDQRISVAGGDDFLIEDFGNWRHTFYLESGSENAIISLYPSNAPNGTLIDSVEWFRPVQLDFEGAGGRFKAPVTGRYLLSGLTPHMSLYDVTDPWAPVRIEGEISPAGTLRFDGVADGEYLVAVENRDLYFPFVSGGFGTSGSEEEPLIEVIPRRGAILQPALISPVEYEWWRALDADILYIGPAQFIPALTPLLDWRRSAGYQVAAVPTEAIYAGYSDGATDPDAIRSFIRYAAANGDRAPLAVTLVGDGTSDPRNYTRRNNQNHVPPYLAEIDLWLGEAACDTCYGQVDGLDPLEDMLQDVMTGRFPVKNVEEVDSYVAKLLAYEQGAGQANPSALYVTDNFQNADGTRDGAGNFALAAEQSIELQPAHVQIQRVYYDPSPESAAVSWRYADAVQAYEQTLASLNTGPDFFTYFGHAHHWQLASTDLNADPPYLLGLLDVDGLSNQHNPTVIVQMTCLSSAFQTPAFSGTTLDERLVLHKEGGAIAVWGPTGLGVAYGHDALQRGFYEHFWSAERPNKEIGALAESGYMTLFSEGVCCQEPLRTYLILGDPMMVPRAAR